MRSGNPRISSYSSKNRGDNRIRGVSPGLLTDNGRINFARKAESRLQVAGWRLEAAVNLSSGPLTGSSSREGTGTRMESPLKRIIFHSASPGPRPRDLTPLPVTPSPTSGGDRLALVQSRFRAICPPRIAMATRKTTLRCL